MRQELFVLDDQAHYFANSIRQASPEYDKIFDYLRGPGGMLSIANHTGDGFLDHFFTKTATHVACLNLPGISDISGVNGMRSLELFAETRDKAPDRVILFGFVSPLDGEKALQEMDHQFYDLGAKVFKWYPNDPLGRPIGWWADDPKIAYPFWEKLSQLGIKTVSIHKLPFNFMASKWQDPADIDTAAGSFPELNFVVYHMGFPAIDKVATMCSNRPNVYADIGAPLAPALTAKPLWFTEQMCKFLALAPSDRLCWGSDMMVVPAGQELIEAFWNWQVPPLYQKGYGIQPLTSDDKKKIMGRTFAKLIGLDPDKVLEKIRNDSFSKKKSAKVKQFLTKANAAR